MATPLTRVEHRSSEADLDAMWAEQENAWHLGFALIWASTFVVVVLAPAGHLGRLPEMALLVVLAVVYAAFGVPGMRAGGERRGHAYLVLAWLCVLGMQVLNADTQSWLLYFILFPHLWVVLHTRLAIITTVLILAALAVIRIAQSDGSREVLTSIGLSSVISLGLSLALGLFIDRILREAQTRARTIDELNATRNELSAAERDRGCSRSESGCLARSTTPSRRGSRRCWPCRGRPTRHWPEATSTPPGSGSPSSTRPPGTTSVRPD